MPAPASPHSSPFRSRAGLQACVVLTLAAAAFAFVHVMGRGIHTEAPPVGLSFWRWLFGALVLWPFVYPGLKANAPVIRKHIGGLTLLGGYLIASTTCLLIGLNFTTAINASIINASEPVFTVLLALLLLRERLRLLQWCGVALGLTGVTAMITRMELAALLQLQFNEGDILILLSSLGYSLYAINIRKIPEALRPSEALFIILLTGCILVLPFYVIESLVYKPVPFSANAIYAIVSMSLVSTVFGTLMWNRGNQLIGPSRAGMFINLIPIFAAVMALIFLDERLYYYQVICTALICIGIFMVLRR